MHTSHAGVENNFNIVSRSFVTTQGVPYDISSVMHYGAFAFTRNGQHTWSCVVFEGFLIAIQA